MEVGFVDARRAQPSHRIPDWNGSLSCAIVIGQGGDPPISNGPRSVYLVSSSGWSFWEEGRRGGGTTNPKTLNLLSRTTRSSRLSWP